VKSCAKILGAMYRDVGLWRRVLVRVLNSGTSNAENLARDRHQPVDHPHDASGEASSLRTSHHSIPKTGSYM